MKKRFLYLISFFCISLLLSGCDILNPDKNKKILQGKREAVFESGFSLEENKKQSGSNRYKFAGYGRKSSAVIEDSHISHTFDTEYSSAHYPANEVILHKSMLLVLHPSGVVTAYDANSKIELWSNSDVKGFLRSGGIFKRKQNKISADLRGDVLYAGYGPSGVVAFDTKTGRMLWKQHISGLIRGIKAAEGKVLVITADDQIYAMDSKGKGILWRHTSPFDGVTLLEERKPVVYKNVVLFQDNFSEIIALSLKTGQEVWSSSFAKISALKGSRALTHPTSLTPTLDGDTLFFAQNDGTVFAINLFNNQVIWSKNLNSTKQISVCGNRIYTLSGANQLISLSKSDGELAWAVDLSTYSDFDKKSFIWNSPVVINNTVILISSDGKILRFDAQSGKLIDEKEVFAKIYDAPLVDKHHIYLNSNYGKIVQYSK